MRASRRFLSPSTASGPGSAVALALALVVPAMLAGCATAQEPSASAAASDPVTPSVAASAVPSVAASEAPTPSPTEAPPETVEFTVPVAFSITIPGEWREEPDLSSATTRTLSGGIDRWVVFTQFGPDSVDDWVERLATDQLLTASEPRVVDIGGAEGVSVDVRVAEEGAEIPLIREAWGEWTVDDGRPNRLWIVDVDGEIVVILTDAPDGAFDTWIETVEQVLATIEWGA